MFITPAFAQSATDTATGFGSGLEMIILFVPLMVVWYFLLIRPQQARAKQHKAMIEGAKKGDVVITGGGLVGRVIKVDGDEVEVELAPSVRVRAIKSTLTEVRGTTKPAND